MSEQTAEPTPLTDYEVIVSPEIAVQQEFNVVDGMEAFSGSFGYAEPEGFTSNDQLLTTDVSGNIVSVDPTTRVFYCDASGASCTQPQPASIKVGTSSRNWTLANDTSNNFAITRNGISNAAISIDSSGYLFKKNPCIRVYGYSSDTSGIVLASSSVTITTSGTVAFEYNPSSTSMYSSSTGRFTAPYTGVYRIIVYVRFIDSSDMRGIKPSVYGVAYILKNSDYTIWCPNDGSNRRTLTWTDLQYLTSGQQYHIEPVTACGIREWHMNMELVTTL